MGVFSKFHRFHEAGEAANVNNVERFGEPDHSLYTSSKVFTLHHHIDITDDQERLVYEANSKALSIRDKTDITDAHGGHVAHIESRFSRSTSATTSPWPAARSSRCPTSCSTWSRT